MSHSLTYLRAHLYEVVDDLIKTGQPVEIERRGHRVKLVLEEPKPKLYRLKKRKNVVSGNSDDLVHMDWSSEWHDKDRL